MMGCMSSLKLSPFTFAGPSERSKPEVNRFFKVGWKEEFPWLEWDEAKGIAHCVFCRAAKKNNTFARGVHYEGNPNFRKNSFRQHGISGVHVNAALNTIGPQVEAANG